MFEATVAARRGQNVEENLSFLAASRSQGSVRPASARAFDRHRRRKPRPTAVHGRTSIVAQIRGEHILSRSTDVFVLTEKIRQREDSHEQSFMQSMMRSFAGPITEMVNRVNTCVLDVARDNQTESFITNACERRRRGRTRRRRPSYLLRYSEFGSARVRHYVDRRRRGAHSGGCVPLRIPPDRRTSKCTGRDSSL